MTEHMLELMIGGVFAVAAAAAGAPAWISIRGHRQQNKTLAGQNKTLADQNQTLGNIEDQVTNGGRNLRDDIDRLISLGEETREDVAELRGELRGLTHRVDEMGKPNIVRPRW